MALEGMRGTQAPVWTLGCRGHALEGFLARMRGTQASVWASGCRGHALEGFLARVRGTQAPVWASGCRGHALEGFLEGMRGTQASVWASGSRIAKWLYGGVAGGGGGYLQPGLREARRGPLRPAEDNRPPAACCSSVEVAELPPPVSRHRKPSFPSVSCT